MKKNINKATQARRKFISDIVKTTCGVGLLGVGVGMYSKQATSMPADAIRPPGAIEEDHFLGSCIRCGLCVRDCPYNI